MTDSNNYSIELLLNRDKCPKCKDGLIQTTPLTPPDDGIAIGCNRCKFPQDERVAAVFDSYEKAQHFVEDHTTDESWRVSHDIEEWEVM